MSAAHSKPAPGGENPAIDGNRACRVEEPAVNSAGHPAILLAAGLLLLAAGAVELRPDVVALGLVPLVWLGVAQLHECVLFSMLSRHPLQASLHPQRQESATGQSVSVTCRLRNHLPLPLGIVRMDARTCAGLSCEGHFVFDMAQRTEITFDMQLLPLRPGSVFFHGFRVQISPPLGLFPREYVLHLPVVFAVEQPGGRNAARHPRAGMRFETRVEPGTHGDFSHLRMYVPGDPHRAVVPSASLRRRKPVVQLVHPEISREWIFLVDVSPAAFSGLPGFSFFDHASSVLPLWLHVLRQSQAPAEFRAFSEDVSRVLPGTRPLESIMKMADLRFRIPVSARLSRQERWWRVRAWVSWVYGMTPPEDLPEENAAALSFLVRYLRPLVYARGKMPDFETMDPDELLERFCAATGLEMPSRMPRTCGLVEELQRILSARPAQLVVFSPMEPIPDADKLEDTLRRLERRGFSFLWMLLDADHMRMRPHGLELLELENSLRLERVYPVLRRYGSIHYYNPSTFARQLPQLIRASVTRHSR